jgi:hypothetical protein
VFDRAAERSERGEREPFQERQMVTPKRDDNDKYSYRYP